MWSFFFMNMIEPLTNNIDSMLLQAATNLQKQIGNTPMQLFQHWNDKQVSVLAKLEWMQLSGSVKARAAYRIILTAIREGKLSKDIRLLDATSGNTGIAYGAICRQLGIQVTLCLPENASAERKVILENLGVQIIYTSPFEGTDGAQAVALELSSKYLEKYYYADQYKNPNNWKAHYNTTAPEILSMVPDITNFVAGLGTTGTFIGTGRRLKDCNSKIQLTALHPDSALHGMEGWKHMETAVIPEIYDPFVADENVEVTTEEAYETLIQIYKHEGLLLSPSSAANLAGAFRIARKNSNNVVVTILPDNAEKYGDIIKKLGL